MASNQHVPSIGCASAGVAHERNPMSEPTYTIAADGSAITCHKCGMTSYNPNDVAHRYCDMCKRFHADAHGQTEEVVQLTVKLGEAHERIGYLERMCMHAEGKAIILEAQLGGWEAACAAQVRAARIYLDATADIAHTGPQIAARGRLVNAIHSNAGELLLAKLSELRSALEVLLANPTDAAQERARAVLASYSSTGTEAIKE